jgi:hypothetical protein
LTPAAPLEVPRRIVMLASVDLDNPLIERRQAP